MGNRDTPHTGSAAFSVGKALDEAPRSRFHLRAVIVSGAGFFTDAYDLFVISIVAALVAKGWHLSTAEKSWVTGSAILGAFVGALVLGRVADRLGRKSVYAAVAGIMIFGALLSAFATGWIFLVVARFILGVGIGGDYPVSAVLMSEYSNRADRGRMVGLVFSMQALGLIVGPLVALGLLSSGASHDTTWRLLLGLGAVPAATVLWLRARMPESPRFEAHVRGYSAESASALERFSEGVVSLDGAGFTGAADATVADPGMLAPSGAIRELLKNRSLLRLVLGTAGSWLLFDYAYYGNTLSLPAILKKVAPSSSLDQQLLFTLGLFVVCALPGYLLAVKHMDRIGHKRLQLIGFAVMAATFLVLGAVPVLTTLIAPFLVIFGVSYLFIEFGPNTTTFVLPSELFPVRLRTTGHGIAASIGKLGAFIGVFLVPALQDSIGLRGMLLIAAGAAAAGLGLTLLLPEPARRSLDEMDALILGRHGAGSGLGAPAVAGEMAVGGRVS